MATEATVRERVAVSRAAGSNGGVDGLRAGLVSGVKLTEAASYLKSARIAILNWSKEAYLGADQVDRHIEDIRQMLDLAETLAKARGVVEAKASVFGA